MERQTSIAFEGIESDTPETQKLSAKYKKSFAYFTVKDRLPVILTKVINYLVTNKKKIFKELGETAEEDLKIVIGKISKLKNEVITNKSLLKITSKDVDVEDWNNFLENQIKSEEKPPCWYYSSWLYVECYMYRRLWEIFESSQALQNLDPFNNQKEEAFDVSLMEIKEVAAATLQILEKDFQSLEQNLQEKFMEFLKLSLWSNRCDLSLLTEKQTYEKESCLSNVNAFNSFLLIDDSQKVYEFLKQNPNGTIDFICDNSSYEIFSDFCFCDFLCTVSLISKIRFHVKRLPWYVSDAMQKDIVFLLEKLKVEGMNHLSNRWKKYFKDNIWSVSDENYWTLPCDYNEMKTKDPFLYNFLAESILIIFKGDLNYRKLLGDINWNFCTTFDHAVSGFLPTSILALRTVKSDIICGLTYEKCDSLSKDKMWMRTGEYAVIQFACHN